MKQHICLCMLIVASVLMFSKKNVDAAIQCYGCHGTSIPADYRPIDASFRNPSSGGFPGNHRTHMDSSASSTACATCHPGSSNYTASHRDGQIKVSSSINKSALTTPYNNTTSAFPQTAAPALGSCAGVNCHFETTTPTWGNDKSLTTCSTCHGAPPSGNQGNGYAGGAAGSHAIHNIYYSGVNNCVKCHPGHAVEPKPFVHASSIGDRKIIISLRDPLNNIYGSFSAGTHDYLPSQVGTHTYGTCKNTYCHSTVQAEGGTGEPAYGAPTWGINLTACNTTCHGVGGNTHNTAPTITTGSHTKHLTYDFGQEIQNPIFNCTTCHHWPSTPSTTACSGCHTPHGGAGLFYPEVFTKHVNGVIDITFNPNFSNGTYNGSPVPRSGYSNCTNTYCHSSGVSVSTGTVPNNTTANWGTAGSLACNGCHGNKTYTDFRKAIPLYTSSRPTTKSNSHSAHLSYNCNKCHVNTTSDGVTITSTTNHVNKTYDVNPGNGAGFTYAYTAAGGTCNSILCHGNTSAQWGATACLGCHSIAQGSRAAITSQFASGNSHHIQGVVTNDKCYQCHWEANSDGSINQTYHNASVSGAAVRLVIYSTMQRPRNAAKYFIAYTANGKHAEIQKINTHCLGCHSTANDSAQPFGDGKAPKQYAWDGTSVGSKYTSTNTTTWGKYPATPNAAQKNLTKAYSAHGNAVNNNRGWNPLPATSGGTGVDGAITNTSGAVNVTCYDCHNSHGSTVAGITSRYSSATGRNRGGILKDTVAGKGGYTIAYKPYTGGSTANKNKRNPGATLCLDCHMNASATSTPWGYSTTFGATQAIQGYWDSPYFGPGTFGSQVRYNTFKNAKGHQGGHFGGSTSLSSNPVGTINGLCTPCHDPHGVTDNTAKIAAANKQYAVPLLKGTFMTSPYKEDTAPASTTVTFGGGGVEDWDEFNGASLPAYNIDQSTFGNWNWGSAVRVSEDVTKFGGLCLQCHVQSSLNPNPGSSNYAWRSMNRIHNTVKGWGGQGANAGNAKHSFTCSKCHTAHNSRLPRLMISNCLDYSHRGRVPFGGQAGNGSGGPAL